MGLIKAIVGAAGGVLADQWKEFFTCDALDKNTIMVRGQKMITGRSSNTKGNDNVISNGSGIAVADGQCMIITDQGKVVEVCAEPGEYTYDSSSEPSIFAGKLGTSILESFKTIGKRFTFGGDPARDQRVYYFNTKEIIDNKFGTATPIPFRVVDSKIGLDIDTALRCNGVYSFKVSDPIIFYTKVCGKVKEEYKVSEIADQLKTEFVSALGPAISRLSDLEIRPNQIPGHNAELEQYVNEELTKSWAEDRGLTVVKIAMNPPTLPEEDAEMIKTAQRNAIYANPAMAAGALAGNTADAVKLAAANPNGAMNGFVGMGMAGGVAGGIGANLQGLYAQGAQMQPQAPVQQAPAGWTCSCGAAGNTGNFCSNCGTAKPAAPAAGGFCPNCGNKFEGAKPRFCPNCGKEV